MSIQALRDKRAEKIAEMRRLHEAAANEDRDLTTEEAETFDNHKADAEELAARIERAESLDSLSADLDEPRPARSSGRHPGSFAPEPRKEFASLGEFVHAVRFNQDDQRLIYRENDLRGEQRMDDGPSGGFAVPEQFRSEILRVEESAVVVRPRANVIPAGNPPDAPITMPALEQSADSSGNHRMFGGVSMTWIGEGSTKPETDAKLREIKLEPHEVAGHIVVTDKLLRNWQAAGPFLQDLMRRAIMSTEDNAFLQGDGVAKPRGVLNAPSAKSINRQTANDVKYEDIIAMEENLWGNSAVWVGNKKVKGRLRRMEDTEGHLIFQENARVGEPASLLGRAFIETDQTPGLGSKGDLMLLDLSQYLIKDGSGIFISASEHVHFTANKTVIKAFWNVDGQSWLKSVIETRDGETYSPIVLLDVPA